eukprot:CAMPEP_0169169448 /NCGR_PEP_ID=MMETSP1015-20121227/61569_1 /TAXON_ID=342587 /ORGANISM="Karlodinium micrum, Strain CCMP2283" /LENGTH=177 /DNA_ID=CAMNT_0009242343 /DNA_START=129 /DNA_END=660 /DNA_ORIENTATION=-
MSTAAYIISPAIAAACAHRTALLSLSTSPSTKALCNLPETAARNSCVVATSSTLTPAACARQIAARILLASPLAIAALKLRKALLRWVLVTPANTATQQATLPHQLLQKRDDARSPRKSHHYQSDQIHDHECEEDHHMPHSLGSSQALKRNLRHFFARGDAGSCPANCIPWRRSQCT